MFSFSLRRFFLSRGKTSFVEQETIRWVCSFVCLHYAKIIFYVISCVASAASLERQTNCLQKEFCRRCKKARKYVPRCVIGGCFIINIFCFTLAPNWMGQTSFPCKRNFSRSSSFKCNCCPQNFRCSHFAY